MPNRWLSRGLGALTAAMVSAAPACGGNSTTPAAESAAASAALTTSSTATTAPLDEPTEELVTPIEFLSVDDESDLVELRRQTILAGCMAAEGFEYVPFVSADMVETGSVPDPVAAAAERGFGFFGVLMFNPSAVQPTPTADADDPNLAIRANLPAEEQVAYDAVMIGREIDPDTGAHVGCALRSFTAESLYGDMTEEADRLFADVGARVAADARLVEAMEAWTACMGQAGYEVGSQDESFALVAEAADAVTAQVDGRDGLSADEENWLEEFRLFEIGVATADAQCYADEVTPIEEQVYAEASAAVLEGNEGLVVALLERKQEALSNLDG